MMQQLNQQPGVLTVFWGWALHGAEHKIPKSISAKEMIKKGMPIKLFFIQSFFNIT